MSHRHFESHQSKNHSQKLLKLVFGIKQSQKSKICLKALKKNLASKMSRNRLLFLPGQQRKQQLSRKHQLFSLHVLLTSKVYTNRPALE